MLNPPRWPIEEIPGRKMTKPELKSIELAHVFPCGMTSTCMSFSSA
jgi:hypothetical protein